MKPITLLSALCASILLSACTSFDPSDKLTELGILPEPYRIDIQQGTEITAEQVAKLEIGMSKAQVTFIMGTPLLVDTFHAERWDYAYFLRPGTQSTKGAAKRHISLQFKNEKLATIEEG